MKQFLLCATALLALDASSFASTISTLEDVPLNARNDYYNGTNAAPASDGQSRSPDFASNGFIYHGISAAFSDGWVASNHTDTSNHQPNSFQFQYDAITGRGANNSSTYGVAFDSSVVRVDLPAGQHPLSGQFTNTTYPYYSMLNGDSFAKKFSAGDWFKLTISGLDAGGQPIGMPVDFYLADFRSPDPASDFILNSWAAADLTPLGNASSLLFSLSSSDNSTFGGQTFMNTPSYFAMDNLTTVPEPAMALLLIAVPLVSRRRFCDRIKTE
jgi:hypothetical protein